MLVRNKSKISSDKFIALFKPIYESIYYSVKNNESVFIHTVEITEVKDKGYICVEINYSYGPIPYADDFFDDFDVGDVEVESEENRIFMYFKKDDYSYINGKDSYDYVGSPLVEPSDRKLLEEDIDVEELSAQLQVLCSVLYEYYGETINSIVFKCDEPTIVKDLQNGIRSMDYYEPDEKADIDVHFKGTDLIGIVSNINKFYFTEYLRKLKDIDEYHLEISCTEIKG